MNAKSTLLFIRTNLFFIFLVLLGYSIRIDLWAVEGLTYLVMFIVCLSIPVVVVTLLSFFSPPSEYEGKVCRVYKDTPVKIQFLIWMALGLFSFVLDLGDLVPFPAALPFLLFIFSWVATLVGLVSQRLVVLLLSEIVEDDKPTFFTLSNRYLNVAMFGYVYILFSRMITLPWYVRKPAGLIIMLSFLMATMISLGVFHDN